MRPHQARWRSDLHDEQGFGKDGTSNQGTTHELPCPCATTLTVSSGPPAMACLAATPSSHATHPARAREFGRPRAADLVPEAPEGTYPSYRPCLPSGVPPRRGPPRCDCPAKLQQGSPSPRPGAPQSAGQGFPARPNGTLGGVGRRSTVFAGRLASSERHRRCPKAPFQGRGDLWHGCHCWPCFWD